MNFDNMNFDNVIEEMKWNRIKTALEVHDELMEWCESFKGSERPDPILTISGYYIDLAVGDVVVWDTESGYCDDIDREDLTFDGVVECYKNLIAQMSGWREE